MKKIKGIISILLLIGLLLAMAAPAFADTSSVMQYGSRGDAVKQLQGNLIYLGYLNDVADGIFGAKTQAAVMLYQKTNGLGADGIVGSATNKAIQKEVLLTISVLNNAYALMGIPYVYGGSTTAGFDCSGFTQYVYKKAGITIPRVSYEQAAAGKTVSYAKMRPGDLVCFNSPVSHVGIYIGNGKFIHASTGAGVIKTEELRNMNLTKICRFTGAVPA